MQINWGNVTFSYIYKIYNIFYVFLLCSSIIYGFTIKLHNVLNLPIRRVYLLTRPKAWIIFGLGCGAGVIKAAATLPYRAPTDKRKLKIVRPQNSSSLLTLAFKISMLMLCPWVRNIVFECRWSKWPKLGQSKMWKVKETTILTYILCSSLHVN